MFSINKRYNFITLAPPILGAKFNNVKVIGVYSFKEAINKRLDLPTINSQIFTALNQNPIPDPKDLVWVEFETDKEIPLIMATAWIDPNSITLSNNLGNLNMTVESITDTDVNKITKLLRDMGYTKLTYTTTLQ